MILKMIGLAILMYFVYKSGVYKFEDEIERLRMELEIAENEIKYLNDLVAILSIEPEKNDEET